MPASPFAWFDAAKAAANTERFTLDAMSVASLTEWCLWEAYSTAASGSGGAGFQIVEGPDFVDPSIPEPPKSITDLFDPVEKALQARGFEANISVNADIRWRLPEGAPLRSGYRFIELTTEEIEADTLRGLLAQGRLGEASGGDILAVALVGIIACSLRGVSNWGWDAFEACFDDDIIDPLVLAHCRQALRERGFEILPQKRPDSFTVCW
jgi:hypothetical protein